jgi:capsular polysaccharide biosynthesis protein
VKDSEQPTGMAAGVKEGLPKPPLWTYEDFPEEASDATDAPASKLISLGDISAAIKRSKRLWCIAAVVGLLLGSALFITTKPSYQVSVAILITNDPSQDPVTQQATNQLLAQAPTLASVMVKKLGLDETPTDFLKTYTATVTSNSVLTIAVNAPTDEQATNWAASLATQFLQYRAQTLQSQQNTIFTAENLQLTQEQQALTALNKQISQAQSGSATAGKGTSLTALQAKQAKDTAMVAALEASVASSQATMRITTTSMISGSSILGMSPATPVNSRKKTLLEYVVGGLLFGLVVGMGYIAVRAIVTDRLRRRSEIAEALGAPVRISVPTAGTGGRLLAGRRGSAEPDGGISRVVGYLRNALPSNARGPASLAIIAVDNEKAVAPIVAALAAACAREGKRVLVADLSGGALAGQLGEAKQGVQTVTVNTDRIMVSVPPSGDIAAVGPLSRRGSSAAAGNGVAAAYSGADILITLAVLDPGVGADHLSTWANEAVAVVTAGASTTVKIHATGEMIRGAGIHLASAVLLGADSADESLGAVG